MKDFNFAKDKKKKKIFHIPTIKTKEYEFKVWILPIAPFFIAYDKIDKWNYNRQAWSEEKAKKTLNYFLPYVLEYVEEDNAFYYCTDWRYSSEDIAKRVPFGLRKWVKKFKYQILEYLETRYENPKFTKSIEKDSYETWIKFEERA